MPQQHIAKWRGEGACTKTAALWVDQADFGRKQIIGQTQGLENKQNEEQNAKKKDITLCKWVGSWELQCLPRKDHFNLNGSELRGFLIKDRFGKKKKKTDFECAGFPCGGLFLLSLPEANVSLSVKIVCFDTGSCTVSILSKQAETHSHQTARCLGNVTLLFKGFLTYVNLSGDVVTSKSPVPVW